MSDEESMRTVGPHGDGAGNGQAPELIVRAHGSEHRFAPGTDVHIGRDPVNDVVCEHSSVSRRHATLAVEHGHWTIADAGSRHGVHVGGERVARAVIDGPVDVKIGDATTGDTIHLEPNRPAQRPGGGVRGIAPAAQTWVPSPSGGGAGASIQVVCGGREYRFDPPQEFTIGRGESCDIVCESPLVSRLHARVAHTGQDWVLEDAASSRGTYWEGEQVHQLPLHGTTSVSLGSPEAGEKVLFSTAGETPTHRAGAGAARHSRLPWIVAAIVVGLAGAAVLIALLASDGSGADLARQKRATVRIVADDGSSGSGTIVSKDGLVLTNAHVAAPNAPGLGVRAQARDLESAPKTLTIYVTSDVNKSARPAFHAKVVAADGFLDLAVLRIFEVDDGTGVTANDLKKLEDVSLGDSDRVHQGDAVTILGFPAVAQSSSVDVTKGTIGAPVTDPLRRVSGIFEFNSDARVAHGNSGGLAANAHGRIIGVPSAIQTVEGDTRYRLRAINLAKPLIDAATHNRPYNQYRFVKRLNGNEAATAAGFAVDRNDCGEGTVSTDHPYRFGGSRMIADFTVENVDNGQDLAVVLTSTDDPTVPIAIDAQAYDGSKCIRFQPRSSDGTRLGPGDYTATLYAGPNYEKRLDSQDASIAPG